MDEAPPADRCPLCGQSNACALADGTDPSASSCWCASERFPESLTTQLPGSARGRACICLGCLRAHEVSERG